MANDSHRSASDGAPADAKPVAGVLSRSDLERLKRDGALRNPSGPVVIGQDTLKLHVGDVAWRTVGASSRKLRVSPETPIRILPGDTVTIVTQEEVTIPLGATACIYPRGRLLPIGILSTTVHVDPGFQGNCRIIVSNVSRYPVEIPFGYEVARLQITLLTRKLTTPYVGVNVELRFVNPQADDLVQIDGWHDKTELDIESLARRIEHLELLELRVRRMQSRTRMAIAYSVSAMAIACLVTIVISIARSPSASPYRDLIVQTIAGILAALVVLGLGLIRTKLGSRFRFWISNEARGERSGEG